MLVLSRKQAEQIRIGDRITITVLRIGRHKIQIGIDAPSNFRILRTELESLAPRTANPPRRKAG